MLATKGLCEVESNKAGKRERTPPNRFIHPGKSRRPFGGSIKHVQESANPRHPTKVVIRARNEHGAEAWFGATQEAHADTLRRRTNRQVEIFASGVLKVAVVVASMLISSSCSILNQPINPDAQSAQTGGATTSGFGNGGAGGSSGADTTQACLAALASITCPTSGLEVPCLASISHCMLDNCAAWEPACAKCLLGPAVRSTRPGRRSTQLARRIPDAIPMARLGPRGASAECPTVSTCAISESGWKRPSKRAGLRSDRARGILERELMLPRVVA